MTYNPIGQPSIEPVTEEIIEKLKDYKTYLANSFTRKGFSLDLMPVEENQSSKSSKRVHIMNRSTSSYAAKVTEKLPTKM